MAAATPSASIPAAAALAAPAATAAAPAAAPQPHVNMLVLHVSNLAPEVGESELLQTFAPFGAASCRVCVDQTTKRSLGYAYVNFARAEDAQKARKELNYHEVHGKQLRITYSVRDPYFRRSGFATVFIQNLPPNFTSAELESTFSDVGTIVSALCKPTHKQDSCYGYISFDSKEKAEAALTLNGLEHEGRILIVKPFVPREQRRSAVGITNLYVKQFPASWTDETLEAKFAPFGEVLSAKVMLNADGKSRCFGFVNFKTAEQAKAAIKAMHESEVDADAVEGAPAGKVRLYVTEFQNKVERRQALKREFGSMVGPAREKNLYIKNLSDEVTDEQLRAEFAKYGSITSASIMRDNLGASRCFGFVCFSTPDEANEALKAMNKTMFHGRPLYVSIAQRKDERAASIAALQRQREALPAAGAGGAAASGFRMGMGSNVMGMGAPFGFNNATAGNNMMAMMANLPLLMSWMQMMQTNPALMNAMAASGAAPPAAGAASVPASAMPGAVRAGAPGAARAGMPATAGPAARGLPAGGAPQMMAARAPGGPAPAAAGVQGGRTGAYQQAARQQPALAAGGAPGARAMPARGPAVAAVGMMPAVPAAGMPVPASRDEASDFLSRLTHMTTEERRNVLGDRLYPQVLSHTPAERAAKVTGMLLELDVGEILNLLESSEALGSKVKEALEVLQNSETGSAQ